MSDDHVHVDLSTGRATIEVDDLHMKDYGDLVSALLGGGPSPVPSIVSYRVEWTAAGNVNVFDNVAQQFRGAFRNASAQMEWAARTVDFDFLSAPIATSASAAAQLGSERNGAFY